MFILVFGLIIFYSLVIWWGLRICSSAQKAALGIRAAERWPELCGNFGGSFLYAVFQDL